MISKYYGNKINRCGQRWILTVIVSLTLFSYIILSVSTKRDKETDLNIRYNLLGDTITGLFQSSKTTKMYYSECNLGNV